MLKFLSNFLPSGLGFWGYLAVAVFSGTLIGVVVHRADKGVLAQHDLAATAKYDALVLADAKAAATVAQTNLRNFEAFATKQAAADKAGQDRLHQLEADAVAANKTLGDVLTKEGKADAPLALCLARKLPPSVLHSLTR